MSEFGISVNFHHQQSLSTILLAAVMVRR